jgi:hypothetical protein
MYQVPKKFRMNKLTTEYVYADFKSVAEYTPEYASVFFEKYADYFKTVNSLKDNTELNLFIELTWQHLHMLYVKNMYAETFAKSTTYLKIIDNDIHRLNSNSVKNDWYYGILFFEGMSSYRLGRFKMSTAIFERLTQYDGKKEDFKMWHRYAIYQQNRKISKTIMTVCIILLLTEIVFEKQITSYLLKMTMLGFALVGFIVTICIDQYLKRAIKKKPLEKVTSN